MTVSRAVPTNVALLLALALAGGCNQNSASSSGPPDAHPVCPATPEQAIGAACATPGLVCGPQYVCGLAQASLLCVCSDGVFQCTDGMGRQLQSGDQPTCPPPSPMGSCPSNERSAQLAGCGDQGLICSYPSPCSSSLDQCQCFAGTTADGGFGLRFECVAAPCVGPEAGPPAIDSGPALDGNPASDSATESGVDSGMDGSLDDADASDGLARDSGAD